MEKKKKTGPDECCRAERQIGYEVRTLNQVIGRLVNSYQSKVDEKAGINRMQGGSLVICTDIQKRLFSRKTWKQNFRWRVLLLQESFRQWRRKAYYQRTYSKRCQTEASGAYRKGNGISDGNYGEF